MKNHLALVFIGLGIVWGCNPYFTQLALPYLSPLEVVWWRVLCGFIPLLLAALLTRSLSWQHWRYSGHFFLMSLLATSLYYWLYAHGAKLLPSGIAGVLSAAIPMFTFAASAVLLRQQESITRFALIGMVVASLGIVCIAQPWQQHGAINGTGVMAIMAGSAILGLSFVYARKFLAPLHIKPLALSTYQMGFACVSLSLITPLQNLGAVFQAPSASVALILGLGVMGTGVAYLAYYYLIEKMGAILASTSTYVPPAVALIVGYVFAGESINATETVGIVIMLLGVICIQFGAMWWHKWQGTPSKHAAISKEKC